MTKQPHRTLSASTHRKQPAVKVEYESGQKIPGNESSKTTEIYTLPFRKKSYKNSGSLLMMVISKTDKRWICFTPIQENIISYMINEN
jgi:hypothetical protein